MKNEILFDYPNKLKFIFDKLNKNKIKPILVGGYVRDKFLNLDSKDIDIELYGVSSYEQLEEILQTFGNINHVGKSFGVCKLSLNDLELDFTLPRRDNKIGLGHHGFEIIIDEKLDFKTATSRRDFTINAIGFDTINKKILDPFNGLADIKNKTLRAVNLETFGEDPLRVLRAVGFASRFNFKLDDSLFSLCKSMCEKNTLAELAQERIYGEVKKILLKSTQPSLGFLLLKKLNGLHYLHPLETLNEKDFYDVLTALDVFKKNKLDNEKTNITIMLSILCYKFITPQIKDFITNLTNDKTILKELTKILENDFQKTYTDSELLELATKVNIEYFLIFSASIHKEISPEVFTNLKCRAIKLGVLHKKVKAFVQGRDLVEFGLTPSKEFSVILDTAYKAQISLEITSKEEAKVWLQNYLKNQGYSSSDSFLP